MPVTVTYTTTHVVVNSGELFEPGGAVHLWASGVARELHKYAVAMAPPGHSEARFWGTWSRGHLQRSIKKEVYADPGNIVHFDVWADVPYAKYVHEGTAYQGRRFIYTTLGFANKALVDSWIAQGQFTASPSERGYYMPITRIPGKTRYLLRVHGQRANPFLRNAYNLTAKKHPGLPKGAMD